MRPTVMRVASEFAAAEEPKAAPETRGMGILSPHAVEREVHRRLSSHPGLRLQSLVVHKTPAGVCLEGRAELLGPELDLADMLKDIEGVDEIINRLMPAGPCLNADLPCDDGLLVECYQG